MAPHNEKDLNDLQQLIFAMVNSGVNCMVNSPFELPRELNGDLQQHLFTIVNSRANRGVNSMVNSSGVNCKANGEN